jgi:uncharacterized protein (TIGR02594 family)
MASTSDLSDPPWLVVAKRELGVRELPGAENNPRVIEYIKSVRGREDDTEFAWCSAFVNWCIVQSGLPGTGKGAARSWSGWGVPLASPRPGCIAVLWRESPRGGKGHVGFWTGDDERGRMVLYGGNQNQRVGSRPYDRARLLSFRWPSDEMLAAMARPS